MVFPRLLVFHRCFAAPRVVRGGPQHLRGGPDDRDSQPRCRRRRRCIQAGCWFQKIGAVNVRKSRWTPQNIRQVHGCSQSWSGYPLRGPRGDCAESALGAGRLILQMHRFLTADFLGQTFSALVQLQTLLLSVHLLGRPGCKTASDMLNDLYAPTVKSTRCGLLRQSASVELAIGCGIFAPRSCFGAYKMTPDAWQHLHKIYSGATLKCFCSAVRNAVHLAGASCIQVFCYGGKQLPRLGSQLQPHLLFCLLDGIALPVAACLAATLG